ncbi:MAG: polysaccharide deacetylase family protein [Muricauda sp.]|nr:polysaccharide deacetylase family protein [Allomuricauda sp.]MBO6533132.1 polysaccharide deacetylase family protein [Allomuricauda sp.]MBO6588409.1 polysaccharide deacetylase family protein [Allomuricauda sp.]MBO6618451.1 polysaccharide deacetylase family protein [Allomuricauda sp.]MBO6643947.1 polysaccharide deacetylase family protein [Allomuricauda sp.]MBO6746831.1 polysaccharide deacetylase family protein [Allomuricauda sp.]
MLLIFTHKVTNRLTYTAKHLFERILGVEMGFTTKVEDFIKHNGPKMTYSKQPLQNEFFIRSNDLLFEQGINDLEIKVSDWDGIPCFFASGEKSTVPFDIFSASFFLLSRYEEYLPHVKDSVGRFPVKESIAYQHDFLELPVVDLWAYKLLEALQERFPDLETKEKSYSFTSIINVTTSHAYAMRGISRTLGGFLLDLGNFRFREIWERFSVLLRIKKDPYNNFFDLVEIHKKFPIKTMFFFQFAKHSAHDKNVATTNNRFRYLIKSIADYSIVSLSTSFVSTSDKNVLREEKKQLGNLINRPISYARLRYNKVNVPATYRNLVETEFTDDFSMGYTHEIGFRAGTCTPFYFYDINTEVRQPIKIHPFAMHDYALVKYKTKEEVFEKMDRVYRLVKQVKGDFVLVFSNELLGGKQPLDWMQLYQSMLKRYYV